MPNSKPAKATPAKPKAETASAAPAKAKADPRATEKAGASAKGTPVKRSKLVAKPKPVAPVKKAPGVVRTATPPRAPSHLNGTPPGLSPFLLKQHEKLLQLRDSLLDSMSGVAKDTLRSRAEGSEASAFGMHQADAGSDAYDRDFALSLLSQEQDALYEIEEALKRIELGTYGVCEMSNKPIAHARLEALPFARCTVECQAQLEKHKRVNRSRTPVTSLFGLTDDEGGEAEEEETTPEPKEDKE